MHPSDVELGLDRVKVVIDAMALSLPGTVIIVAGTNGKGSVCAMIESIALQAGYRVGTYTSPHLVHFNERGRINGDSVTDDQLVHAFEAVDAARQEVPLTYFEFTTLAILSVFADAQLDLNILEIGLGGRLDAVNAFEPHVSILTCVDVDHAQFLGDNREAIGSEKAHVFRPGKAAICADPQPPQSVLDHAAQIGADLWLINRDFSVSGDRQQWAYAGRDQRRNSLAYPALRGANQLLNAAAALAAFEALRQVLPIAQKDVRQGFAAVQLPGRCQIIPGTPTVVLDVAHNPHAVAHLAANMDNMGFFPYTYAVFGAMADKDIDALLDQLGERIDHWIVCDLPVARAATARSLARILRSRGAGATQESTITECPSAHDGLRTARKQAGEDDRIIVFGSFFTVADILSAGGDSNKDE